MSKKSLSIFLAGVCVFALPLSGGSAHAETLPEAVRSAVTANPTVDQAMASQSAAREEVNKTWSNYFPTVSVSTSAGRVYGDNATSRGLSVTRGAGYSGMWEGSLTVSQMIFDGLKTPRQVGAGEAREQAAEAMLAATREALALQTALAYLNVLRARDSLRVYEDYKGQLADYADKIRKMVGEGIADQSELQQAEVIMLELENLIAGFKGQELAAGAEYMRLTGHLADKSMAKPAGIAADSVPPTIEEAVNLAFHKHPQMMMTDHQIRASGLTAEVEESSLYPNVTGELSSYRKDVDDLIGGEVEDDRAVVRATWELSTGGAEFASIRKARHDLAQAKAKKGEVLRSLDSGIRTAYANLSTSAEQQSLLTRKLEANINLLAAYRSQFEAGKVRILQLLQSENQTMNTRVDLLNAEYRYLAAQYSILGSIGMLQENLMRQPMQTTANVQ